MQGSSVYQEMDNVFSHLQRFMWLVRTSREYERGDLTW